MIRVRASLALSIVSALMAVTLAACTSGPGSSTAGSSAAGLPDGDSGQVEGAAAAPSAFRVDRMAVKAGTDGESVTVGPAKGGTLTVRLPSGAVATLVIEAGAVDARTRLSMAAFIAEGVEGVVLEPAGTWLAVPARLTFTSTDKVAAVRVGHDSDGNVLFAVAATDADGSVPIVRLRPVVLLGPGQAPPAVALPSFDTTAPQPSAGGSAGPGQLDGPDPLDGKAAGEEAAEAKEPGGDTGKDEAADEGGRRAAALAPLCGPDVPQAAAQALEAWRTAGSQGTPPVDCAMLRAEVNASVILEFSGSKQKPYQETVGAEGSGLSIDKVADLTMPAQREVSGIAQLMSLVLTAFVSGVGVLAGIPPKEPSDSTCSMGSVPQGKIHLETVPLPGDKVRVTIDPRHPRYTVNCAGWRPEKVDLTVWDFVREAKGTAEGEPIVFTVPMGENVYYVLDSLKSTSGETVRHGSDGSVTIRADGVVIRITFGVGLRYEPAT